MFLNERQEIEVLRRFYSPHRGPEYDLVLSRLRQLRPAGRSVSLFNKYTCLQMMVRILKEGRVQSDPEADIVGPELLRYYLAIEEEIGVVDRAIVEEVSRTDEDDPLYFQKFTWPMTLKTYWLSRPKDIVLELCKLVYGLKHLMDNPAHTPYVEEYLKQMNCANLWVFSGKALSVVRHLFMLVTKGPVVINHDPEHSLILDAWSRSETEIGQVQGPEGLDVIYTKPILKLNTGQYLVLDASILALGIHDSFLHHFYTHSGIRDKVSDFRDLKKEIGFEVIEKRIFRRLMNYIFDGNATDIEFPPTENVSLPDALIHQKHDWFVFEMKDASMPYNKIRNRSFDDLYADIRLKLIRDPAKPKRGAAVQLATYMNNLIKSRNVSPKRVYPIAVYSDTMYSLPGISNLVVREHRSICEELKYDMGRIPTIMSLDYLFSNATHLKCHGFKKTLWRYTDSIKKGKRQHARYNTLECGFQENASIEHTSLNGAKHSFALDKGFMRAMFGGILPDAELATTR